MLYCSRKVSSVIFLVYLEMASAAGTDKFLMLLLPHLELQHQRIRTFGASNTSPLSQACAFFAILCYKKRKTGPKQDQKWVLIKLCFNSEDRSSSLCFTRFSLSGQQMFWLGVKYVSVRLSFPAHAIHFRLSFLCHGLDLLHHLFKNKHTNVLSDFLGNSGN